MKKIVLFPYHPDLKTLIDQKDALRDVQIIGVLSFEEDKNLMHSLNHTLVLNDVSYDQLLHDCDTVILLDNYRDYETKKYYEVIEDALVLQKEILITPLAQSQLDLKKYINQFQLLELMPDCWKSTREDNKIYEIDVPVIGVIGQGKHCGKFENQLLLKEILEAEYETITVTTNALGVLFGCYTIPSFLYEDRPFEEKIFRLNQYVRKISKLGNPDVIILGIPEGVLPFERQEYHHFAEYPLIITAAVPIDMAILCTYFMHGLDVENGLKKITEFCHNKFNVTVGAIAMSQTAVEIPSEEYARIIFEYLDKSYLHQYYPDLENINLPIIDLFDRDKAKATIKMSLRRLQENVRTL